MTQRGPELDQITAKKVTEAAAASDWLYNKNEIC